MRRLQLSPPGVHGQWHRLILPSASDFPEFQRKGIAGARQPSLPSAMGAAGQLRPVPGLDSHCCCWAHSHLCKTSHSPQLTSQLSSSEGTRARVMPGPEPSGGASWGWHLAVSSGTAQAAACDLTGSWHCVSIRDPSGCYGNRFFLIVVKSFCTGFFWS